MDFDMSGDEEISELERLRQKNMKEFEAMMSEFAKDINESIIILNDYGKLQNNKRKKKAPPKELFERRRSDRLLNKPKRRALPEELFGRRRSDRLLNITPRFSFKDLEDDERKRRKRLCLKNSRVPPFVAVEDITDTYLESIAMRVVDKTYSSRIGTSCHQCCEKTLDSKTYCRSGDCIGLRGQFCGICLKTLYGENAKDALLDPEWKCPPCRGVCHCSICRQNKESDL